MTKRDYENDEYEEEDDSDHEEVDTEDEEMDDEEMDDDDDDEDNEHDDKAQDDEDIEELQKELEDINHMEQDILRNLKRHKDDDILKGQAVKNQKALWDKTLELRISLQKPFSNSNRLPMDPFRDSICKSNESVNEAYSDLINSSKKTLESILELQEALLQQNQSITQATDGKREQPIKGTGAASSDLEYDEEWLRISQMQARMASFRNKSIDKWQRKTQVTTGAAAMKGKLQAFNQNISDQVAAYIRDPTRMLKGMRLYRSKVAVFGTTVQETAGTEQDKNEDGDPELLDDSEFFQQLLKEFFENIEDPASSEAAMYALKRTQNKKRKIVDRRASKSRKIRYNIHEKIVNFMAPQPFSLPPMAPQLFENLFGLKSKKIASPVVE
ncbi:putative uncharacterized protein DDB_G0270496 [Impatiens glandulifera]|uniref:putative uncharacterized protein DDB_G0270496 n=1 Tax=Impatiens glandulifera TaxID=253017 RepID=UPI001FB18825|nr:putative uncharacterized protein DDB_G0270496 [Impatiens glandulifera]